MGSSSDGFMMRVELAVVEGSIRCCARFPVGIGDKVMIDWWIRVRM